MSSFNMRSLRGRPSLLRVRVNSTFARRPLTWRAQDGNINYCARSIKVGSRGEIEVEDSKKRNSSCLFKESRGRDLWRRARAPLAINQVA